MTSVFSFFSFQHVWKMTIHLDPCVIALFLNPFTANYSGQRRSGPSAPRKPVGEVEAKERNALKYWSQPYSKTPKSKAFSKSPDVASFSATLSKRSASTPTATKPPWFLIGCCFIHFHVTTEAKKRSSSHACKLSTWVWWSLSMPVGYEEKPWVFLSLSKGVEKCLVDTRRHL